MQKLVQQRMKMLETLPKILGPVSVKISDVHTGAWRYRRTPISFVEPNLFLTPRSIRNTAPAA